MAPFSTGLQKLAGIVSIKVCRMDKVEDKKPMALLAFLNGWLHSFASTWRSRCRLAG